MGSWMSWLWNTRPVQDELVQRADVADNTDSSNMLRVVLFGKTGSGKSSTGNTILGRKGFMEVFGQSSGTVECRQECVNINGTNIKIIDTPGVCDSHRDPKEVLFEVSRCLCFASPGPHALLFVINAAARFTQEEYEAYADLRKLFDSHLINYIILVFTNCEGLNNDKEQLKQIHAEYGKKVDNAKKEGRNLPDIRDIVRDASNRIVLFSNTADKDTKDRQVLALLDEINNVSKHSNHDEYFRDARTERTVRFLEKWLSRIIKENPGMTQAEAWAKLQARKSDMNAVVAAVCTGVLGATFVAGTGGAAAIAVGATAVAGVLASTAKDGRCSVM